MAPGLDNLLVGTPYVAVFPECPGPAVEVGGLVVDGVSDCDGGFVANCGAGVVSMRAAAPGHGAGSQGKHMKSAVLGIDGFSVPFRGHHALSDLQ